MGALFRSTKPWLAVLVLASCSSEDEGPHDASSDAVVPPVDQTIAYAHVPPDGGECPLAQRIELWSVGTDLDPISSSVELLPPATIHTQKRFTDRITNDCTFPSPVCGVPEWADFADLNAALAHPEVQAALAANTSFGPNRLGYTANSGLSVEGIGTLRIYADALQPPCDTTSTDCLPEPVRAFAEVVRLLGQAHQCEDL